jgi:hypothetical protein
MAQLLTINLLPEGARKTTLSPVEQFHRTPLMWLAAGLLVAGALVPLLPMAVRQRQMKRLNITMQALTPKKVQVEQLRQYLQELREQEAAFRWLGKGQGLWAQRLNLLSNVAPDGVWYRELALDQTSGLVIQGSAIGQGGAEMTLVGRLVQDLKANPDFSSAVKDIQIESVTRVQDGEIEVVQFTLVCSLRERPSLQ